MLLLKRAPIRAYAERQNCTIAQAAMALGIEPSQLYKYFRGDKVPSPQTRARLCRKLGLKFDDLFERAGTARS